MNCELRRVPLIIAEAGVNHNGSVDTALRMVREAAEAGADYVKFQTFVPEALVSATAPKAAYQQKADGAGGQLEMLRRLALDPNAFAMIAQECRRRGIGFMSTPFDAGSADFLASLGQDYWKIPSGEVTDLPYLRKIGSMRGRVIMSTGMCELREVEEALGILEDAGTPRSSVVLLHCNTQYPTPFADVNLRAMDALRSLGAAGVGYSDHTPGIAVPVAAAALGADVVEKHFTLSRNLPGPDHKASLEPGELRMMVEAVRAAVQALGSAEKTVSPSERANILAARRSLVAARDIRAGEAYTPGNVTAKRPGGGPSPMLWDKVMGRKAPCDIARDQYIQTEENTPSPTPCIRQNT